MNTEPRYNEIAKFLAETAKDVPPELAEPYYQYAKSLLSPDMPPAETDNHIKIITPDSYEQNNPGK